MTKEEVAPIGKKIIKIHNKAVLLILKKIIYNNRT
jgi:hypothetical protein